ncbi:hypothetical protein GOODEAATRI_013398 [Goodea atripinnis]|uniref:NHR domain-containing protein n=1 Tax=Goodea atripinnis TaxID=208336 RepID=A0ABV0NJX0_9TELE
MSPGTPCSVAGATTTSDLRFHQLHGTNAVITNGGRTALRQNCRSEFNDAIVISNSGTAIMQDGNTMRNNYGCDLDSLTTGSRIGMMRTVNGDLHYYINGLDQGVACSGLPAVAGVAHRLHSKHGKNVVLLGEGCQAIRVGGYSHGIVFSAKELKADELFEVRIDEVDEQWCGSLHIGLTTLAPPELPSCPLSGLSPSLPQLRTKVTWLLCGSEVRRNGVLQRQNYGYSLDRLTVGNRVGVKRCNDDTMHIFVDGEDMGPASTAVPKVRTPFLHLTIIKYQSGQWHSAAASGFLQNVYAVLDLYGRITAVSIVSSSLTEDSESIKAPSLTSESCSEGEEDSSPVREVESETCSLVPTVMMFLENHGKNIQLSNQSLTAARVSSYNQGLLVTAQSLARQQLFQIDRLNPSWTSSLSLGVIGHSPDRLNFPSTACCLKRSAWLLQRDSVFHNSLKVNTRHIFVVLNHKPLHFFHHLIPSFCLFPHTHPQICENYGPNLDTCPEGTVLGLLVDTNSCLHLYVNGMDQGVAAQDIPSPCYPFIDLYGQCEQVGRNAEELGRNSIKESVCWTPPPEVNPNKTCEYQALCSRFKDLLTLPDGYFNEDAKYNLCYCESCHKLRGDEAYYKRGEPPRDYALPFGWCRFALRWEAVDRPLSHIHSITVRGTSSIFLVSPVKTEGQNGYTEPEENSAPGREVPRVRLSPTMRYSGVETFAPKVQFQDPRSHRCHQAQVGFQVCVRPGSYKVGPQTLGQSEPLDPRFSNSEVEWITKEQGGTLLYGLLIRVE